MEIMKIGQRTKSNSYEPLDPPVYGWHIEADDHEIEDLAEGLDAYIEDLEQFEDTDHSECIACLKSLRKVLTDTFNS